MTIIKKKEYINKYIKILDIKKKYELCKMLLIYNVELHQNNNGVYLYYSKLDDDIIDIIYNYISNNL